MFEFAAHYAWLIPLCPLIACGLLGLIGYKIKPYAHVPAIVAMGISFLIAISLLIGLSSGALQAENLRDIQYFDWFTAGNFHIEAAITIDQLTALYLSFITGIGLLIFIYAIGYNAQGINIQARVCFIQYSQFGLQHGHLENFISFLLTS